MALDIGEISTGVDSFISLVRSAGRIEINEAAVKMGMSKQVLEEWANVLEEQGLIKVEYQLTKVYLVWVARTREELETKAANISDVKVAAVRTAESQVQESIELLRELETLRGAYSQISTAFELRMGGAEERLGKLKDLRKQREELSFRARALAEEFDTRIAGMRRVLDKGQAVAAETGKFEKDLEESMKSLEPQMKKMRELKTDLDAIAKDVEKREKAFSNAGDRVAKLRKEVGDEQKELAKLSSGTQGGIKQLESASAQADSRLKELTKGLDADMAEAGKLVKDFDTRLTKLKQFDRDLGKTQKDAAELNATVSKVLSEIKALDWTKTGVSQDDILRSIGEAKGKLLELERKREHYQGKQQEMKSQLKRIWELEE